MSYVFFRGLVIAMVVSVFFLLLLRFTAPILVWVLIVGVLAVGAFGEFFHNIINVTCQSHWVWDILDHLWCERDSTYLCNFLFSLSLCQGSGTVIMNTCLWLPPVWPSIMWASALMLMSICRCETPGWPSVSDITSSLHSCHFASLKCIKSFTSSLCSDYSVYRGGHSAVGVDLFENTYFHSHRTHSGDQQVITHTWTPNTI